MLWTAFIVGFAGSLHCVGMCGPIALALPVHNKSVAHRYLGATLYNLGRSLTYALLGTLVGLLGAGISLAGYQQGLSIFMGVSLLVMLAITRGKGWGRPLPFLQRPLFRLKQQLGALLQPHRRGSLFLIGLLNGLLPCGFVYLALAAAASTGSILGSAAYMGLFGLGTLPLMLGLTLAGNALKLRFNHYLQPVLAGLTLGLALLLIARGLDLGIPFISPQLSLLEPANSTSCH